MNCELCKKPFDTTDDSNTPLTRRIPLFFACCQHSPCLRCTAKWHRKQASEANREHGVASYFAKVQLTCPSCRALFVPDSRVHTYYGYMCNRGMVEALKRIPGKADDNSFSPLAPSLSVSAALPLCPTPGSSAGGDSIDVPDKQLMAHANSSTEAARAACPARDEDLVSASLSSSSPAQAGGNDHTTIIDGVSSTRRSPPLRANRAYGPVISYSIDVPATHTLLSSPPSSGMVEPLPAGIVVVSYVPTDKLVSCQDLVGNKYPLMNLRDVGKKYPYEQGACLYGHDARGNPAYTMFITPPHILLVQRPGVTLVFGDTEPLRQVVEIAQCKCVAALGSRTILLARTKGPNRWHPSKNDFVHAVALAPFAAAQTVLAVYEHYLLIFCGHQYLVYDPRTYSWALPVMSSVADIKTWTENHAPRNHVTACCVNPIYRRVYLLTGGVISVCTIEKESDSVIVQYDTEASRVLANHIPGPVSRVHWVSARPASLFFVLGGNSTKLYELTSLDEDDAQPNESQRVAAE